MAKQTIYTVGGTVQAGGGIYIKRKADDELLELCRQGEFAFILSSRQVGKSSLMVRTAQQLEKENIRSVTIDLSAIGVNVTADEWYLGILNEIYASLNLETDIFTWWKQYDQLGPAQRLTNFFKDILLKEVKEQIVLFFDEIDSTLSIPFSDDFYVAIRAVYNARSTNPEFKRLSFVLVGVATPADLISDNKRTPFNIGRRVEINDFTLAEARPLVEGLGQQAGEILTWVLQYTGGHPYLTQRLCAYLAAFKDVVDEQAVADAVERLFTGEQGKQDNNLQFVRDMLSARSPDVRRVLLIYRDIRSGKRVVEDERSIAKAHLKLSGLVRSEQGILRVRNQIYNTVFNTDWVNENIPKNWTKITAYSFGLVSLILLTIFIYDFVISNLSSQYVDKFYRSQTASEKLEYLAKIFDLEGILPNSDYDSRARDLFFSLAAREQEALFKDSSSTVKAKHLATVVRGLYVTMANVEGGQNSTPLMLIMKDSLRDVDASLRAEIDLWLQARASTTDQDALVKCSEAIRSNGDNPATHYERAAVEIRLGLYEQALLDLDATMALAQNLSTDAAEAEMPTPAPLPTYTGIPPTNIASTTTPLGGTVTSLAPTQLPAEIGMTATPPVGGTAIANENPAVISTPDVQPVPSLQESYKSSFYSRAYIRSAVDILLKKIIQAPGAQVSLVDTNQYTDLVSNGLLPASGTLATSTSLSTDSQATQTLNSRQVQQQLTDAAFGFGLTAEAATQVAIETLSARETEALQLTQAAYVNTVHPCDQIWWVRINLTNKYSSTFKSMSLSVKDTSTGEIAEPSDSPNIFLDRDPSICNPDIDVGNDTGLDELEPDRSFTVSSGVFLKDPTNHLLEATIKLCTEEDLVGECSEKTIVFTPGITAAITVDTTKPTFPYIILSEGTNCRTGPGTEYDLIGAYAADTKIPVLGKDPTGKYWVVASPNRNDNNPKCWLDGSFVKESGNLGNVEIYSVPPTPTPKPPTSTP